MNNKGAMTRHLLLLALVALPGALPAQQITFTNPVAGAQVPIGTRCTIGWTNSGLAGQMLSLEVILSGQTARHSVANLVPAEAGQYQWDVPWELPPTSRCQISIQAGGEGGPRWDGPEFAVVSNTEPALLARAPAGGEQWPRGATRSVSWEAHNLAGNLTLELLRGGLVVNSVSNVPIASNRVHYAIPAGLDAGSNYTFRLTSASAPSVLAASPPFSVTAQPPAHRKWTILFYFDADAFMTEADTINSFLDLAMLPATTNINYVCQVDRSPKYATSYGNWYDTKRFVIQPGLTPTPENAVQDLGELNMSAPGNLTDFINWSADNYPADKYFLVLSDHGKGWHDGLLLDESNGGHDMSTRQLQQALDAADTRMTILGLDMCVEAEIEIAYQIRNTGPQILIASQYQESRYWPYRSVFQQLESKLDSMTLEGLAALFCESFVALHSNPLDTGTLGAIRLTNVNALTVALTGFADTLVTNYTDQPAVRQKAEAVAAAFNDAVFYCARTKSLQQQVYGLNINFPMDPAAGSYTNYTTQYVDFPADSHWRAFLTAYYQNMTNSWIGQARASLVPPDGPIDLYLFCRAISPATNAVKLTMVTVGSGTIIPVSNGSLTATNGDVIRIDAIGLLDPETFATNYFVRWVGSANAVIADRSAAATTVQLTGDALVVAYFATNKNSYLVDFVTEGNGSFSDADSVTNTLTLVVPAGGDCSPVTALADPGYVFSGWGGDYPATGNPLTITNVNMDTTVIAFFWPAPPAITIHQVGSSVNLAWPAGASGYVLESSRSVSSGPWTPVPDVTTNAVMLPISNTNQFFRLRREPLPQ